MTTRRDFLKIAAATAGAAGLGAAVLEAGSKSPKRSGISLDLLFLGGTGFIGPHQVQYALDRGHRVTVFHGALTIDGHGKLHEGMAVELPAAPYVGYVPDARNLRYEPAHTARLHGRRIDEHGDGLPQDLPPAAGYDDGHDDAQPSVGRRPAAMHEHQSADHRCRHEDVGRGVPGIGWCLWNELSARRDPGCGVARKRRTPEAIRCDQECPPRLRDLEKEVR